MSERHDVQDLPTMDCLPPIYAKRCSCGWQYTGQDWADMQRAERDHLGGDDE